MSDRKAGPVTLALGLILFGCLLLIANIAGLGILETALKFWPVLLIGLGAEYFIRNYINRRNGGEEDTKFHLPTVVIILLVAFIGFSGQQAAGLLKNQDLNALISEAVAGTKYNYRYDFKSEPIYVKPGSATVRIDGWEGTIDLAPSTDGKLYVEAGITAWGPSQAEAKRRAEMVKININEGEVISVSPGPVHSNNYRRPVQISYRVLVPAGVNMELENGSGRIRADKLQANLEIKDSNGDIDLSGIKGNVAVNGTNGKAQFRGIEGSLDVTVESGNLTIRDVTGNVRVDSENSRIEIVSTKPVIADYNVTNRFGDILLRIPETSNATVTAKTRAGAVRGTLSLNVRPPYDGDPERHSPEPAGPASEGSVILGQGKAKINLYSENGSISVDKN